VELGTLSIIVIRKAQQRPTCTTISQQSSFSKSDHV